MRVNCLGFIHSYWIQIWVSIKLLGFWRLPLEKKWKTILSLACLCRYWRLPQYPQFGGGNISINILGILVISLPSISMGSLSYQKFVAHRSHWIVFSLIIVIGQVVWLCWSLTTVFVCVFSSHSLINKKS